MKQLLVNASNTLLTDYIYIIIFAFVIALAMGIVTIIASKNITLTKLQRLRFGGVFLTIAIISLADMGSSLIEITRTESLRWLDYTLTFWTLCSVPYIPIALATILHGGEMRKNKQCLTSFLIFHVYVLVLLVLTCTGHSFSIDENMACVYHLPGLIFYIICYAASVLFLLIDSLLLFKRLLAKKSVPIFILFLVLVISTSLQLAFKNVRFTYLIISIISIIFYDYYSSMMSQVDGLTGVFSQYAFIQYLPLVKKGETIIVMDADEFKAVNDTYGHLKGDETLIHLANCIQQTFYKSGITFRIGGDEFVVVCKKSVDFDSLIKNLRNKILASKSTDFPLPDLSIGFATCDGMLDGKAIEHVADQNMYLEKARHRASLNKEKLKQELLKEKEANN